MNTFQLIKTVLEEAYGEIPGDEAERDAAVAEELSKLSEEYKDLLNNGCLDYSDPARRFAYLFRYTTSHANLVYSRIGLSRRLANLFDGERVVVSCVGGGPGSDFLGILKYCLRNRKSPELKCQILDRDPAWGESWSDVDDKLRSTLRISTVFFPFDVTEADNWGRFSKHFSADLFTLIYFMSEVYAKRDLAEDYFSTLMSRMKDGAVLLYVDNNDSRFQDWFDRLARDNGLRIVSSNGGWETLPWDEDKDDLQPYLDKFGPPKLRANISWRLGVKGK
ncbi:MAG: hypothetical protein JNM43_18295 [Planctomycetaceae bacterium]|nr:hypothetical protein [Planctomycetaceae bacterium]